MAQTFETYPVLTVEAGFGYGPTSGVVSGITWTDISAYVRGWTIQRGKQTELMPTQAGTLNLVLNNRDRRFEPQYASSPYYPYIRPGTPIRISVTYNAAKYYRGVFYANEWPVSYNGPLDSTTTVTATDYIGFLQRAHIPNLTSYSQEASGTRINHVLQTLNYTSGVFWQLGTSALTTQTELFALGTIDAGISQVQAATFDGTSTALTHISLVEQTELGRFFANQSGICAFYQRGHAATDRGTFTDQVGGSNLNYEDLNGLALTDNDIRNDVQVTPNGLAMQEATDSTSQTNYGTLTYPVATLATSTTEAAYMAQWLVALYKDPKIRIRSFTVRPRGNPSLLWPAVLPIDLGDQVTIVRTPPPSGAAISQTVLVQGYSESMMPSQTGWEYSFTFYTGPDTESGWILGQDVLDTDTVIAF